jgi:hypothetical protein
MPSGSRNRRAQWGSTRRVSDQNGTVRVFVIGAEDYRRLSFRDMIEASEASGVDAVDIQNLTGIARIRALAALAWVITRRTEPDLTYDQVLDGRVEQPEASPSPLGAGTRTP